MCPCPAFNRRKGCHTGSRYPITKIFANNIALLVGWGLCMILTAVNYFPESRDEVGFYARTDAKIDAIYFTKWVHIPYPGQWGNLADFTWGSFIVAACYLPVLAGTVIESYGDYIATAQAGRVTRP